MSATSTRVPTQEGPCSGRWRAEEATEEMLTALREFLAPYRDGEVAALKTHERSAHT